MKHFILSLIFLAFYSYPVFSQLNVYSNGNVGIARTTESPSAKLSIGNGVVYNNHHIDLQTETAITSGAFNIAIDGIVKNSTPLNSGRSIGIRGMAGNSTSGYNYGILGCLWGTQNGAGVFGTTSNTTGVMIPGIYAGYFDGNVCVTSNLKVNGSITGTLISPTSSIANTAYVLSNDNENESVSEKLSTLNAISYYNHSATAKTVLKDDTTTIERKPSKIESQSLTKMHYGLSAEEIESVYPELVYEYENGTKGINYMEMIPLLIQSIKELKTEIDALKSTSIYQKDELVTSLKDNHNVTKASLKQNSPNPFTYTTDIKICIPESAKKAILYIYDMEGKSQKQLVISERGGSTIKINSDGLHPGVYMYSLIVDDNLVSTKKMILNR